MLEAQLKLALLQTYEKIKVLIEQLGIDVNKSLKGNHLAATRIRKNLRVLKGLTKDIRINSLNLDKLLNK